MTYGSTDEIQELRQKIEDLEKENSKLKSDIEFCKKDGNLETIHEALCVAYHAGNLSGHDNTVESRWSADVDDEACEFAAAIMDEMGIINGGSV